MKNDQINNAVITRNSNISKEYKGMSTKNSFAGYASSVYDLESYREQNSATTGFGNSDLKTTIQNMKNSKS